METLKTKLRVFWAVVAAVVILLTGVVGERAFALGGVWYHGFALKDCKGGPYLYTTNFATVHRDAVAGDLLSYRSQGDCVNMSVSGG